MKDAKTLYQDLVLEHGKSPRNEGPLDGATHQATAKNPLCGDRVTIRLQVDGGGISAARFEARGCMIARASASLLTEAVRGTTPEEARGLAALVDSSISTDGIVVPPPLEALAGARDFPARRACVMLAWNALIAALEKRS